MLSANYLADIDASDCESQTDAPHYSLQQQRGGYENVMLNDSRIAARNAEFATNTISSIASNFGDVSNTDNDASTTPFFSVTKRRSLKKRKSLKKGTKNATPKSEPSDKLEAFFKGLGAKKSLSKSTSNYDCMTSSLRIDDGYCTTAAPHSQSQMQRSFIVDPYCSRSQRSSSKNSNFDSSRAKSLDNLQKYSVMSNSFYCPSSSCGAEKEKKCSLNYAKAVLRKLYSTSTSKLRHHTSSQCRNGACQGGEDSSAEFRSAISPFYQIRLPQPEELPYLPYNIHYQVEEDENNEGREMYEEEEETDVEYTLMEDLVNSPTNNNTKGSNKYNNKCNSPLIPSICTTNSSTLRNTSNKIGNEQPLRKKQIPRKCADENPTKMKPIVYGKRKDFVRSKSDSSGELLSCSKTVNKKIDESQAKVVLRTSTMRRAQPDEAFGMRNEKMYSNDSSSLGYSTMSSSNNGYYTNSSEPTKKSQTMDELPIEKSTKEEALQKSSLESFLGKTHSISQTHDYATQNSQWNGLRSCASPPSAVETEAFPNWNALFQFLKSEITEIQRRDFKIKNELTNIERQLHIASTVPCQRQPATN